MAALEWRCAPYARAQGLDPIGSAGTYDCFLLVETPLPWPRDVREHPVLAEAMTAIRDAAPDRSVRVLAIVPPASDDGGEHDGDRRTRLVTRWWRDPSRPARAYAGSDHVVPAAELAEAVGALVGEAADDGMPAPAQDVVVCTHGRRDVCCGGAGSALFAEVADRWPGVRVRRTSHTGGHRFAPTGFTFPEARAWAYLDADLLDAVVRREGPTERLAGHYRGWAALDAPGQVAERELLRTRGWRWLDAEVSAARLPGVDPDAGTAGVELRWTDADGERGVATAGVGVRRLVPTLACGSPPDDTTKRDPEYEIRSLHDGGSSLVG